MTSGLCHCALRHQLNNFSFLMSAWAHPKLSVVCPKCLREVDPPSPFPESPCCNEHSWASPHAFLVHNLMTPLQLPSAPRLEDVTAARDPNQATFSLWHCVLWLLGQKAGLIFTCHFDTILQCNWKSALDVEILTQNTKD